MNYHLSKSFSIRKNGFTLIEMLIVLAVIAAILAGAMSRSGATSSKSNANQVNTDTAQLYIGTHDLKNGTGNYGSANLISALATQNQIPGDLTVGTGNTTISTPLGGTVTITGNTATFTLVWTNVPADVCSSLLENAQSSQWASATVGSGTAITSLPATISAATSTSNCGSGTGPYSVSLISLN